MTTLTEANVHLKLERGKRFIQMKIVYLYCALNLENVKLELLLTKQNGGIAITFVKCMYIY